MVLWWHKRRATEDHVLLSALIAGAVLKAHRTMNGTKTHKLHCAGQPPQLVNKQVVRRLESQHLIQSNMKFPAATYLLTEQGAVLARQLVGVQEEPLTVRVQPLQSVKGP
ncbi:MAG: hypothetical protein KDE19_18315 [Caldilineaceae bacterium]|nr:hypothetical protein [Caldilineaceae bacterium]